MGTPPSVVKLVLEATTGTIEGLVSGVVVDLNGVETGLEGVGEASMASLTTEAAAAMVVGHILVEARFVINLQLSPDNMYM